LKMKVGSIAELEIYKCVSVVCVCEKERERESSDFSNVSIVVYSQIFCTNFVFT
jgi:hypothetical protein